MKLNTTLIFNLLFVGIISVCGCTQKPKRAQSDASLKSEEINFDEVIKCNAYVYEEGIFYTPDYGCIYDPIGPNKYGNLVVYLLPKKNKLARNNQKDFTKKVNAYSISKIKKEFSIYIFAIEKEYLHYNPKGDPIYYPKERFVEKVFEYHTSQKKWLLKDSISIHGNQENETKWREKILNSARAENGLDDFENAKYLSDIKHANLIFAKSCDLNQDGMKDSIFIMKRENYPDADNYLEIQATCLIRLSDNGSFVNYENSNIFPNATGDFFEGIDIQDNFFTIRLFNEVPSQYVMEKYITFVFRNNNIFLKSYRQIRNEKRTDFEINKMTPIPFEDFDEDDVRFPG